MRILVRRLAQMRGSDYPAPMALFQRSGMWRDVSPIGAIADFREVVRQAGPNRWRIAFLAALPPIGIFLVFSGEEMRGKQKPPEITYITSWRADRSMAEIVASNIANQKRKDALAAEQAKREEETRQVYKTIGRMSGMDVDAIEAKAKAERDAEAARQAAEVQARSD
jgi:hypothetical protein